MNTHTQLKQPWNAPVLVDLNGFPITAGGVSTAIVELHCTASVAYDISSYTDNFAPNTSGARVNSDCDFN